MLHNTVAPLAPMQLSNATDRPGVETSPRGWHTILLSPVPKNPRLLLPQPCLYLLLPPQKQRLPWLLHSSSLVGWQMEATTPTSPWLTADCIQPGRRASRNLGKGGVRSRDPSILTQQAVQQQQVWPGQLSSPLTFAVSKKQITLKVGMGGGGEGSEAYLAHANQERVQSKFTLFSHSPISPIGKITHHLET